MKNLKRIFNSIVIFALIYFNTIISTYAGQLSYTKRIFAVSDTVVKVGDSLLIETDIKTGKFTDKLVQGLIVMGVDHHHNKYYPNNFSVKVKLKINEYNLDNEITNTNYQYLTVQYSPFDSVKNFIDKNIFAFNGFYKYTTTIDSIYIDNTPSLTLPLNIFIESQINIERIYDFESVIGAPLNITAINLINTDCDPDNTTDEIEVSWETCVMSGSEPVCPEEYHLEWTFVNDYDDGADFISASDLNYDFKNNSTRITTTNDNYRITHIFEHGYLLVRVRGIGRNNVDTSIPINGVWNSANDKGEVSAFSNKIYITNEHEKNKNFQYEAVYAEEGKKKEVINYFDGSLRSRQAVTKINSDENVIVGETIYDFQGRKAINVMPVPVKSPACTGVENQPAIKYYPKFNLDDSLIAYSWNDFDVDSVNNAPLTKTPVMHTSSGAANYYSADNPDKEGSNAFIPDANKYPFSQTEYTPDNTGRIKRQSGVGPDHQLGTGHETLYLYGKPNQIQLDRLFGSEVGNEAHYQKNVVIDPNGQASVNYLDMQGRTIATSLAGDAPKACDTCNEPRLAGLATEGGALKKLNVDLFSKDANGKSNSNKINTTGSSIDFLTHLLVVKQGWYHFNYDLNIGKFNDPCLNTDVCFDCIYDLEIVVKDEKGNDLAIANGEKVKKTVGQFDLDTSNNIVFNTLCESSTLNYNLQLDSIFLNSGNYTVRKTLKVNQDAKKYYIKQYIDTANIHCFKTLKFFEDSLISLIDTTDCNIDCDVCVTSLGSKDDFVADGKGTQFEYDILLDDCNAPCKEISWCDATYKQLLVDVSPGGQYGEFQNDSGYFFDQRRTKKDGTILYYGQDYPLTVFNYYNKLPKHIIDKNAYWKNPLVEINGTNYSYYLDEDGSRSIVKIIPDGKGDYIPRVSDASKSFVFYNKDGGFYYTYPENIGKLKDFIPQWKSSWAKSLVQYHPEYCYYEACRDYGKKQSGDYLTSDKFDNLLYKAETFQQAVDLGLIRNNYKDDGTSNIDKLPDFFTASTANPYDPFVTNGSYFQNQPVPMNFNLRDSILYKFHHFLFKIDDQGNVKDYNMIDMAASVTRCATLYGSSFDANCMKFGTDVYDATYPNATLWNDSIRDMEWTSLKSFYLSVKKHFQDKRSKQIALKYCKGCNECIGNENFNEAQAGMIDFKDKMKSVYIQEDQPCGGTTYNLYVNKTKRFINSDIFKEFDQEDADYQVYLQTGQCPMAFDLQYLLNGIAARHTLTDTSRILLQTIPEFTLDIYKYLNGGTIPDTYNPFTWKFKEFIDPQLALFVITDTEGIELASMVLSIYDSDITSWNDIKGIIQLKYVASDGSTGLDKLLAGDEFEALAKIEQVDLSGDTIVNITTTYKPIKGIITLPLHGCEFKVECKPNAFMKDIYRLWTAILIDKKWNSEDFKLTPDYYGYYITSRIKSTLRTSSDNLIWSYNRAENQFELFPIDDVNRKLIFQINSIKPSHYTIDDLASILVYFNNPQSAGDNLFIIECVDDAFSTAAFIEGKAWYSFNGALTSIATGKCELPESVNCNENQHKLVTDLEALLQDVLMNYRANKFYNAGVINPSFIYNYIDITKSPNYTNLIKAYMPQVLDTATSKYDLFLIDNGTRYKEQIYLNVGCECDIIFSHKFPVESNKPLFAKITKLGKLTAYGPTDYKTDHYLFYLIAEYNSIEDVLNTDTIWGESCLPLKNCKPCNNNDACSSCTTNLAIADSQQSLIPCNPQFINDTIQFPEIEEFGNPCVAQQLQFLKTSAAFAYEQYINKITTDISYRYTQHCLGAVENFTSRYLDKEFHFTLYYYDQAGNLVKTVPPEGVEMLDITSYDAPLSIQINNDRTFDKHTVFTNHTLASTYQYNSLGQVVSQSIPDHDNMAIFEITLPNGLDSRLEVTAMQMIDETKGYLTGKINHNGILRGVLYQTTDAGKTWQKAIPVVGADLKKIQMVTAQIGYAVATHGIVLKTIDGCNSWDMLNTYAINFKGHLNDLFFKDTGNGIMIGENNAVLKTSDGGNSFSLLNIFNDGLIYQLTAITKKGDTYFVSANSYLTDGSFTTACVFKSDDGTTWEKQTQFRQQDLSDVFFYDANAAYAAGENGTLLHSTDRGDTWKVIATNHNKNISKIIFKDATSGIALLDSAGGNFQLYKTFDAGKNWALMSKPGHYYNDLSLYYNDLSYGAKAVAVGKNGIVHRIILKNNSDFGIIEVPSPDITANLLSVWAENINENLYIIAIDNYGVISYTPIGNTDFPAWSNLTFSALASTGFLNNMIIKAKVFEDRSSTISENNYSISGIILSKHGKLYSLFKPSGTNVFNFKETGFMGMVNFKGLTLNKSNDEVYTFNILNNKIYSVKLNSISASGFALANMLNTKGRSTISFLNAMDFNTNRLIIVGAGGEILKGNKVQQGFSSGFDITSSTFNINILPLNDIQYNGNYIFTVGNNGKMYRKENNNSWASVRINENENLNQIKFTDPQTVYIVADNGKLIKINLDTQNVQINSSEIISTGTQENLRDVEVLGSKIFVIGDNRTMLYSLDISSENLAQGIYPKITNLYGLVRKPGALQMLVAAENGNMLLWTGATLTNLKEIYTPPLKDVHFIDANNGTVCGNNYTLRQTHDGGNSWNVIVSDDNVSNIILNRVWTINDKYALAIGDAAYLTEIKNDKAFTIPSSNFNTSSFSLTSIKFQSDNPLSGFIGNQNNKVFGIMLSGSNDNFTISINNSIPLIQSPNNRMINDIEIFQDGSFLVAGSLQTLQYNKGSSGSFQWVDLAPSTITGNSILTSMDFYDKQNAYVVGDDGIFLKAGNISYDVDGFITGISWENKNVIDNYNVAANDNVNLKAIEYTSGKTSVFGGSYNIANTTTTPYVRLLYEEDKTITSRFWYDKLGREITTQNSKQFNQALRAYSYKKYDKLGRVIESGQKLENPSTEPQFFTIFGTRINNHLNPGMIDENKYLNWLNSSGKRTEVVKLFYDEQKILSDAILKQENLRSRIATTTIEDEDDGLDNTYNYASHYSYDIHGNVKTLIQDNAGVSIAEQRYKKMEYEYELISGKVNAVHYQNAKPDQFHHKYEYDADNRITDVYTSKDKILWGHDAKYFYYPHGPLARVELGDNHVQGIDYAYTLQGWIKGINSETLNETRDIGQDGSPSTGNPNAHFAKDAFGYSLTYFEGDYQSIGTRGFLADKTNSDLLKARNDLFNGNISAMVTTLVPPTLNGSTISYSPLPQGTAYKYDQLNRLVEMQAWQNLDAVNNIWNSGLIYAGMYNNKFTYDGNGNIETAFVKNNVGEIIDDQTYQYNLASGKKINNRLLAVADAAIQTDGYDLPSTQQTNNYSYTELGELKQDVQDSIAEIKRRVDGKITEVIRTSGSKKKNLKFNYDATGNRVAKHVYTNANEWIKSEYYVRDAQGNILSTYSHTFDDNTQTASLKQTEKHLYGSSLLGIDKSEVELIGAPPVSLTSFSRTLRLKYYTGNNHLGNDLVIFTDKKIGIDDDNDGLVNYYIPDVVSSKDYGPFGEYLTGRVFNATKYPNSFNGKRDDEELFGWQDYGFRNYMKARRTFDRVDPLFRSYSWNSTYAFAENRVIDGVDLEGLEYSNKSDKGGTYGPLSDEQAKKTGATLEEGFKTEAQTKEDETQKKFKQAAQKSIEFQKANNITPQSQGVIKTPEIPTDLQMAKQIGEGVAQGLAVEFIGYGIGLGIKAVGNIPVSLYRTFGGAGIKPSIALGKYYTLINPKLYGSKYAKFAGLPEWNASTYTAKTRTTLSNLDLGSFGFAKPIGSNTGRFVPEIKVLDADAVKVINFRVNEFANPTYTPMFPLKF